MKISELIKNRLVQAESISNGEELADAIRVTIRKYFPKSYLVVKFEVNEFKKTDGGIFIDFAVAKSREEVKNKLFENDISFTRISIKGMDGDGKFRDELYFEPLQGGTIVTKPKWTKVGLAKKTGTPNQILKHVDNYFKKLLETIKREWDNIDPSYTTLLKSVKRS